MTVTFLTGGARSGKSYAAVLAAAEIGGDVTFVATATALDDEMTARIERHRAERPSSWTTIEEPVDLTVELAPIADAETVIIDCLTLWVTNQLLNDSAWAVIEERAHDLARWASARTGHTFIISNEVGSGIVPLGELTRAFQDALGTVNAIISNAADRAFVFVAGRPLALGHTSDIGMP